MQAPKVLNPVDGEDHVTPDIVLIGFGILLGVDTTAKAPCSRLVLPTTQLLLDCAKRHVQLCLCLCSLHGQKEFDRLIREDLGALVFIIGLGSKLLVRLRVVVGPRSLTSEFRGCRRKH